MTPLWGREQRGWQLYLKNYTSFELKETKTIIDCRKTAERRSSRYPLTRRMLEATPPVSYTPPLRGGRNYAGCFAYDRCLSRGSYFFPSGAADNLRSSPFSQR